MQFQSLFWMCLVVSLTAPQVPTTPPPRQELVRNGGMEGPFSDGIAHGWVKNCYGVNEVVFAEETKDVHAGKSAQRITCLKFTSGGVQFHSADLAVEKGKPYTIRLWMKGDIESPVYIGLRKHGPPYTSYLKRHVRVKPQWRAYILAGEASETDPSCALYLMFAGTGTLLVDEVSVLPGIQRQMPPSQMPPPEKGNRIYNSGFEAGPEGWTPTDGFVLDQTVAHSGRASARIGPADLRGLECRPFPVRSGMQYTASLWIKAEKPNTPVTLRLFEWADEGGDQPSHRDEVCTRLTASTHWQRYHLTGTVWPNMWEHYVLRIAPGGPVWIDDVQVEEGELTDYRPSQPIEVGAETATRACQVGQQVEVLAYVARWQSVENSSDGKPADTPPDAIPLLYTLEDLWNRPVQKVLRHVSGSGPERVSFTIDRPGMYRVRVQAGDSPATGEVWFGVFPHRDRAVRPNALFGTHVRAVARHPTHSFLLSEAMGARWVRLHDFGDFCHWYVVEPEKGRFVWHDAEVQELRSRGFMIMANLGHPPLWAARPHPKDQDHGRWTSAPPREMTEWENYVFKTVEHYRPWIRHWEIWNEPCWQTFFSGTPEEYAELLKTAYRAIKRADPQAVVIGGCFSFHAQEWTKRVLQQDALRFMDALSYHVYWGPAETEPPAPDQPCYIEQEVRHFLDLMRQHGHQKPIYMTEGGVRCPPFASWLPSEGFVRSAPFGSQLGGYRPLTGLDAACGLVRGMVEMLSAGVTNICYYYTGADRGAMPWFSTMANGYYVLTDYDGRPKPTMMAYSALEQQLDGTTPLGKRRKHNLTIHLFAKGTGSVAVVWTDQQRPLALEALQVLDLMGNPMSTPTLRPGEPVFVLAPHLKPDQLEAALK
ncbi:MAG: carbohydrate binding domain-containing protein [Thermoguttaceae bacterium]|nr:carbohydrate binding domain-containing protein [Thermoguttaceae bacterium]MDW8038236.1 carbohydrate binding domain-containing protein [Thermoguttaceae bacterium]